MTDNSRIVPFGKYKGQPIEVMMRDPGYVAWSLNQPDLRTKYANFFTIVVAGGVPPDMPTPEHNRMQLLFRNPEMRVAAYRSIYGEQAFDAAFDSAVASWVLDQWKLKIMLAGDAAAIAVLDEEIVKRSLKPYKLNLRGSLVDSSRDGDENDLWRWPYVLDHVFMHCWRGIIVIVKLLSNWLRMPVVDTRDSMRKAGDRARLTDEAVHSFNKTIRERPVEFEYDGWDVHLSPCLEFHGTSSSETAGWRRLSGHPAGDEIAHQV